MIKRLRKNLYSSVAAMVVIDAFLVATALLLAFLIRFEGVIPTARVDGLFFFVMLAVVVTPIVFWFFRLYRISWTYVALTDVPLMFRSVVAVAFTLLFFFLLFRSHSALAEFPRSVLVLFPILLFLFVGASRFAKRFYWQIMRPSVNGSRNQVAERQKAPNLHQKVSCVLVTGCAGYLGSVLVGKLLDKGYRVKGVDVLWFGDESLKHLISHPNFQFSPLNVRDGEEMGKLLYDVDAVVHMAALVGEPACAPRKDTALEANYLNALHTARLCKAFNVPRFIFFSTCSTYGWTEPDKTVTEESPVFPVDFYGETKVYAERELERLADSTFYPTMLRLSTVYGLSPRMRFDLVVNILTKKAVREGAITIFGGNQWRPLIHTEDVAEAIIRVLEAPLSLVGGQIFNVGDDRENYLVSQIGELVKEEFPNVEIITFETMEDKRSYRVSFDKIKRVLGFSASKTVRDGIVEIRQALEEGRFKDEESKVYYNHRIDLP